MPLDTPLRVGGITLLAVAACLGVRAVRASDPGYEVSVGVIESDNIARVPSGGSYDTVGIGQMGLTWHDMRPWLSSDIDADLSYLSFYPHTFSNQIIGNFLGTELVTVVPQLLSWTVSDNFGQVPLEPLAPITPINRENINYFDTGPTLSLPLGQTTQLNVTGEYGRVNYQHTSASDSAVLTGALGLQQDLSPTSSVSLNARDERMEFANGQLNPTYDLQAAFARFDAKGSRTDLSVDLGYSRPVMSGLNSGTPLVRVDISRRFSASSTIGIGYGHEYSDGADSFRLVQALGGATLNTQPIVAAGPPFLQDFGTIDWSFKRARTTLDLAGSYFRDRYPTVTALNNNMTTANASVARSLAPALQAVVSEYLVRYQFDVGGGSTTETDTALELTWHAGRRLSVSLTYMRSDGSSNIRTNAYAENRLWLSIGYGRPAELRPGPAPVRLPVYR